MPTKWRLLHILFIQLLPNLIEQPTAQPPFVFSTNKNKLYQLKLLVQLISMIFTTIYLATFTHIKRC